MSGPISRFRKHFRASPDEHEERGDAGRSQSDLCPQSGSEQDLPEGESASSRSCPAGFFPPARRIENHSRDELLPALTETNDTASVPEAMAETVMDYLQQFGGGITLHDTLPSGLTAREAAILTDFLSLHQRLAEGTLSPKEHLRLRALNRKRRWIVSQLSQMVVSTVH